MVYNCTVEGTITIWLLVSTPLYVWMVFDACVDDSVSVPPVTDSANSVYAKVLDWP